jgi:hypothetical protein
VTDNCLGGRRKDRHRERRSRATIQAMQGVGFRGSRRRGASFPTSESTHKALIFAPALARILARAAHCPNVSRHIDQMEAAAREFAEGRDIVAMDGRPGLRRRVPDLLKVSQVEMSHQFSRHQLALSESSVGRGALLTRLAALQQEMLPCTKHTAAAKRTRRRRRPRGTSQTKTAGL